MRDAVSPRRFTGWHMTGILVGFFVVVIVVNMAMATIAVRTFGGTVVDNSYVESQKFNAYLGQARAQAALGWHSRIATDAGRHVMVRLEDEAGAAVKGAAMRAVAQHPLGRAADIALVMHEGRPGRYVSDRVLPAGRWQLRVTVTRDRRQRHLMAEID